MISVILNILNYSELAIAENIMKIIVRGNSWTLDEKRVMFKDRD